jgi:hypothetical protein
MIEVTYPEPAFRVKKDKGRELIFDTIRRQWLVLTPEEWVRQNFVQYLVQVMEYPATLVALEKEIRLGELKKRFDILVYDSAHQPWLMVECKATSITLDQEVLEQVLRYNMSVPVPYLAITNGHYTVGWQKSEADLLELTRLPPWI